MKQFFQSAQMVLVLAFANVPNFLRFIGLPCLWLFLNVIGARTTFKEIFKIWADYAVLTMLHRK